MAAPVHVQLRGGAGKVQLYEQLASLSAARKTLRASSDGQPAADEGSKLAAADGGAAVLGALGAGADAAKLGGCLDFFEEARDGMESTEGYPKSDPIHSTNDRIKYIRSRFNGLAWLEEVLTPVRSLARVCMAQ